MSGLQRQSDPLFDPPRNLFGNLGSRVPLEKRKERALFLSDVSLEQFREPREGCGQVFASLPLQCRRQVLQFAVLRVDLADQVHGTWHALHDREQDALLCLKMNLEIALEESECCFGPVVEAGRIRWILSQFLADVEADDQGVVMFA